MFGIGGFNPVSLLATAALGPMGGIVAQLAQQVISQFGQQLIQNLGQQMGLPQSTIDMAQGAFAGSLGDIGGSAMNLDEAIAAFGQEQGASMPEIGGMQRQANEILDQLTREVGESEDAKEAKASGGRGGGWLLAIARALGSKLDGLADKMEQQAAALDESKPSASAEFSATTQQFSMLMNATTNAIKTLGEAMANTARKG